MKTNDNYKLALSVVGGVVREWDPYFLLASDCPADEFDAEIASVANQISRIKSEEDATYALSRVFGAAFEADRFTPDQCREAGIKLFAALLTNGLIGR